MTLKLTTAGESHGPGLTCLVEGMPAGLVLDSVGDLFVSDRANNVIHIYDQEGKLLEVWPHFGKPTGLYIDDKDILRTIAGTVVQRYMGVSEADADAAAEILMNKRSAVVIHPERIVSWDHSKLGGTY